MGDCVVILFRQIPIFIKVCIIGFVFWLQNQPTARLCDFCPNFRPDLVKKNQCLPTLLISQNVCYFLITQKQSCQTAIKYGDLMILCRQTFDFCEKKIHTRFFKKDETFCRSHLFLSHLLKRHNFIALSSSSQLSSSSSRLSDAS